MPATKDGVNVYPERAQPLNYGEYAARLKRHGTSIRRGESVMVTKVKVKDRHVEFQLGGGGYGTAGDETDASVYVPGAEKTRREKNLEEELKRENDPARRKRIKEELDDLRRERARQDRLNQAIAAEAEEARRARIEQKALQGGSRFNVHFSLIGARVLTPAAITEALRKYVDFSEPDADGDAQSSDTIRGAGYVSLVSRPAVLRVGPPTTYLGEGISPQAVVRALGQPVSVTERRQGEQVVTTYVFTRGGGRLLFAEFANSALLRSRVEARGPQTLAAAEGR